MGSRLHLLTGVSTKRTGGLEGVGGWGIGVCSCSSTEGAPEHLPCGARLREGGRLGLGAQGATELPRMGLQQASGDDGPVSGRGP